MADDTDLTPAGYHAPIVWPAHRRHPVLQRELRHKVEIHQMTGRIVECPIDEMNRPRGRQQAKLRIPPTAAQVDRLVAGWREELATCRTFAPAARNYAA